MLLVLDAERSRVLHRLSSGPGTWESRVEHPNPIWYEFNCLSTTALRLLLIYFERVARFCWIQQHRWRKLLNV